MKLKSFTYIPLFLCDKIICELLFLGLQERRGNMSAYRLRDFDKLPKCIALSKI